MSDSELSDSELSDPIDPIVPIVPDFMIPRIIDYYNNILNFLKKNKRSIAVQKFNFVNRMHIYVNNNMPNYFEVLQKLKKHLDVLKYSYVCSDNTDYGFKTIWSEQGMCTDPKIFNEVRNNINSYSITLKDGTEIPFVEYKRN